MDVENHGDEHKHGKHGGEHKHGKHGGEHKHGDKKHKHGKPTNTEAAPAPTGEVDEIVARDEVKQDKHHRPTPTHSRHHHDGQAVPTTLKKVVRPPVMTYLPIGPRAEVANHGGHKPTDGAQVIPSLTRPGGKHPKATDLPKHPKGKNPHHSKPSPSAAPVKPL